MQDKANPVYRGLAHTLTSMFKQEGIRAPWKGVTAGIQRQCAFAPIRIGLYEPLRNFYVGKDFKGDPPILQKIAAGLTTSAIGITIASPTDASVKVRLQAEGRMPAGTPRRYNGSIDAYRKIVAQEGVLGLWTGYSPRPGHEDRATALQQGTQGCRHKTPRRRVSKAGEVVETRRRE